MANGNHFDLRTQKLNKKGQVVSKQPYRLYIDRGVQKYERPPGSGNFFNPDGSPIMSAKASAQTGQEKVVETPKAGVAEVAKSTVGTTGKQIPIKAKTTEIEDLKSHLLSDGEE